MCTCGVTIGFASIRTEVLIVSLERNNACAYGPCCFEVLQNIPPRDSLCPSFKVCGINMSGAANHRLQRAHTWLVPAQVWELSLARASIQGMGTGHEG